MTGKNLPYIALLAAALFFFWIKKHQRGRKGIVTVESATAAYTALRGSGKNVIYSRHAACRMKCRHIDDAEVKDILATGNVNLNKIETDSRGTTYPVEGITHDGQHVRIIFAPHDKEVIVVTVIDTDKEWPCDCE